MPGKNPVMTYHAPAAEAQPPRILAPAAETYDVTKVLPLGSLRNTVLQGISLRTAHGEIVAVRGPTGSGKSTLHALLRHYISGEQV